MKLRDKVVLVTGGAGEFVHECEGRGRGAGPDWAACRGFPAQIDELPRPVGEARSTEAAGR